MSELEKKFIIEGNGHDAPDLAIVYGTSSAQNFNVKKREQIIGFSYMVRVPLNYSGLFDNFEDAAKYYRKCADAKKSMWLNDIKRLDENLEQLTELERLVKE